MIGKTVSHYRIVDKIGQGGMGVVYKAEDTRLHRTVALKFLPESYPGSDTDKSRFINEARAAAALSHPNICTVYEIDEADGRTFIAMEYIDGRSLKDLVAGGPLDLGVAVRYATQIARGLEEAHGKGIIHRDVKSANVVVSTKGHAIVMDFGLARIHGQTRLTQTGTTVGTVSYMSPEQARGDDVDQRSDIWSLGVVLYRMVAGKYPFEGEHQSAVIYAVMNEPHQPLTALRTGVPMALERVVDKALAKDPADRYQSMADMVVDLRAVRKTLEGGVMAPGGRKPEQPEKSSSHTLRWVGLALLALIVAALAWWQFGRGGVGPPAAGPGGERVSIAVLPLENMSGDESKEYFADGMTEALIAELAGIRALRVISRTSVMRFKGTQQPMRDIAAALGVNTIIEGSVMQAGDRVRITAQLIDARSDEHLWARSYERDAGDVLALQSEVARAIADQVKVELTPEDHARLASHEAARVNRDAYDFYLRGRYHWGRRTEADLDRAVEFFTKATQADSTYADAYAALAQTYLVMPSWTAIPAEVAYPLARKWARKALAIDPDHAAAWAALAGVAKEYEWDWTRAGEYYHKSLALDPSVAGVHQWYAEYLAQQGRFDEAIAEMETAKLLDPLALIVRCSAAWILTVACRPEEAIAELDAVIEMDPAWPAAHFYMDKPCFMLGRDADGVAAVVRYGRLIGRAEAAETIARAYETGGMNAFWVEFIDELKRTSISPAITAFYYAAAGQPDSSLAYLERAYAEHASIIDEIAVAPWVQPLRGNPRFDAIIERMGLAHVRPAPCTLP